MFITIENKKMKILILPAEVILSEGMKEEKIERKRLRYLRGKMVDDRESIFVIKEESDHKR
jgi:hypothetical protein